MRIYMHIYINVYKDECIFVCMCTPIYLWHLCAMTHLYIQAVADGKASATTHSYVWYICAMPRSANMQAAAGGEASCNTLQHTATHCNTLQHIATHCNTVQHSATHCNTLQHTATHRNTLQHTATHCNTLQHTATHCNALQHTDAHCNTLQHTAAQCAQVWWPLCSMSVRVANTYTCGIYVWHIYVPILIFTRICRQKRVARQAHECIVGHRRLINKWKYI